MHHYRNLLYISHGTADETAGLKQALSLARNNKAQLKVLVIAPELPKEFSDDHHKKYEQSLLEQVNESIKATKDAIKLDEGLVDIVIDVISENKSSISIIRHVLQDGHDLVIKEAQPHSDKKGFKAVDMDLLRKCPCALWLCRPIEHSRQDIQVAVAIDPESQEPATEILSKKMLQLSRNLANDCSNELHILSCWDYAIESELRNNVFIKMPSEQIDQKVVEFSAKHRAELGELINKSSIEGVNNVHHLRGKAEEVIPDFVIDKRIDILVMGTVARTGIPGFIIGNTAENIIRKLPCSLLALKPQGFISPVKI